MAKHAVQFAVIVRSVMLAPRTMVGMPFTSEIDAEAEADRQWMAGNYSAEVVPYNPITGEVIVPDIYNYPPLT